MKPIADSSLFQSTHSAGNATDLTSQIMQNKYISIHAFRRECDIKIGVLAVSRLISIHAFRRECDNGTHLLYKVDLISIHAFRRECDALTTGFTSMANDFNPRIPQGMRLYAVCWFRGWRIFQSTHSAGNATQITLPLCQSANDFNPRIPQGMRQLFILFLLKFPAISIHAFRRECDKVRPRQPEPG